MRLTAARGQMLGVALLAVVLLAGSTAAAPIPSPSPSPSPVPEEVNEKENSIEAHEDGLLIFVPTIPAVDKEKSGQELKREIQYEIIAIPGDVLRREIREIAQSYGAPPPVSSGTPLVFSTDQIQDFGEVIIPSPSSTTYGQPGLSQPAVSVSLPTVSVSTSSVSIPTPDFGGVITSVAGQTTDFVSGAGQTLTQVGVAGSQVLGQVGTAAATGGAQLASWLLEQKTRGIGTATRVVGSGLQYAGQLSAGVLRALLQVPGIKARVLSELIEASQPLVYAVSDVIADNADELGDFFEAKTSIVQDALAIVIRLIQDTLALKGRIIFSLGSNGLDIGATAFNAGVRIGGAFVESASKAAAALGSGVGDLVRVATSVNLPPPPALPPIEIPRLPNIEIPTINIPQVDLTKIVPAQPILDPIPLPAKPASSLPTITISSGPAVSVSKPIVTAPSLTYGVPGR